MTLGLENLHSYQLTMVDFLVRNKRCALFAPMGMGKTVSVLTALEILKGLGELQKPVLILAPHRVASTTWPDEIGTWSHVNLTYSHIMGTAAERMAGYRKPADIYLMNFENLVWLHKSCPWKFGTVIADESTRLKGFRTRQGTERAKVLGNYAHTEVERLWQLTGTPAANGLKDLWATGWFIDKGVRLGHNYAAFERRWFRRDFTGFSLEPMPHSEKEIHDKLSDVCYSLDVRDHFDIEDPIVRKVYVDLPPAARKAYDQMQRHMFTEIKAALGGEPSEVEAVNAAAKTLKCLQLANGAAYVTEEGRKTDAWVETHKAKIDALQSILEEASGAPVLVAYNFRSDLERLRKAFPNGKVLDKNPKTIADWNAGKIPILFAHPQSAGHGLSLQHGGNILVFFSLDWNLENHLQIIERIGPVRQKQSGYDRPVYVYYILAKSTMDGAAFTRLSEKKSVVEALLEAMKHFTF